MHLVVSLLKKPIGMIIAATIILATAISAEASNKFTDG
jgi:hypothetical protein